MQPKAVLFDMDGVLVDSERHWVPIEAERILPDAVQGTPAPGETTGMNFREIYDYLDEHYETTMAKSEFVERYEEAAREIYGERVALLDGFADLATELRETGVRIAVVSSSPPDWIARVLERFDVEDAFDAVVSAEEIDGRSKPEPDVFEHAADVLGVAPEECVAVEDSENGVESARRAGMTVIGYRNQSAEALDLSAADTVVESSGELREKLLAEL